MTCVNERHQFWECKGLAGLGMNAITDSQKWVRHALAACEENPSLWLRGLPPKSMTQGVAEKEAPQRKQLWRSDSMGTERKCPAEPTRGKEIQSMAEGMVCEEIQREWADTKNKKGS